MSATRVPILGWVCCALLLLPTGPDRAAMRRGLSASTRAARNPGTVLLDCRTCYEVQAPAANAHVRCLDLLSVAQLIFCRVCPRGDEHCARLGKAKVQTYFTWATLQSRRPDPEAAPGLEYFRPANQHSPHISEV